jgi:hypothetical protein
MLKTKVDFLDFPLNLEPWCLFLSIGKLSIEKALDLILYLKQETEIMPVFQGLNELIPMYKLMEKREMNEVETQFKVKA